MSDAAPHVPRSAPRGGVAPRSSLRPPRASSSERRFVPGIDALQRLRGDSAAMRLVRDQIQRIARSPVPVLILGETGTGKELCAEAIAGLSGRIPFVPVNCAAFPESLVESELFGHERGAFTGAVRNHTGVIAQADGGILFLDELAEVPGNVQAKLLRTLESGEYRPLGSSVTLRSDFRILAATSGDLEEAMRTGRLRPDLLHRLGAARVRLPSLRERLEDLPLLAESFLRQFLQRCEAGPTRILPEGCALLMQHDWPGNVRQLRNVIETAAAMAGLDAAIGLQHVVEVLVPPSGAAPKQDAFPTLADARRRAEQQAVLEALRLTGGNREGAAKLLGISAATLYRKLARTARIPATRAAAQTSHG